MTLHDLNFCRRQLTYVEGLINYSFTTGSEDDWDIDFLEAMLKFKTNVSLKYREAHNFANNFVKSKGHD